MRKRRVTTKIKTVVGENTCANVTAAQQLNNVAVHFGKRIIVLIFFNFSSNKLSFSFFSPQEIVNSSLGDNN
jgi:hypothetical protein